MAQRRLGIRIRQHCPWRVVRGDLETDRAQYGAALPRRMDLRQPCWVLQIRVDRNRNRQPRRQYLRWDRSYNVLRREWKPGRGSAPNLPLCNASSAAVINQMAPQ